ncbi:NUDIX domain-containing protein [Bradyrhizobium sp.]|uniref:NUDIX hydrolase n=1 Tax=Bradyrhizobium sp. TaxID=376 RepID=UPI003C190689
MVRVPVLAAGGIVLRNEANPLIAVVRLRKRNEWVLPKGRLDDGETPRAAAEREVWEETGHDVTVHEFLGTLVYESGGRSRIVHYWRMETCGGPSHELMDDVREVDWLPLEAAVGRLSRACEQAFLANVGPLALEFSRRPAATQATPRKRRRRRIVATDPARTTLVPAAPPPELIAAPVAPDEAPSAQREVTVTAWIGPAAFEVAPDVGQEVSVVPALQAPCGNDDQASPAQDQRISLLQKARDWLRRARAT